MKLFLHTLLALLFALPIQAANNVDAAQNLAKKYCQNPSLKKTGVKSSQLRSASVGDPSYFIFSDDATDNFCIVSADGEKILGYGDNYSEDLPPQLQAVLDMYAATEHPADELRSATIRKNIPYFVDAWFGTRSPYNKFIPEREGSGPPVGCVPVVLAQICKYYNYPSKLLDDIPAYSHTSSVNSDTVYYIEGQKAEGRTYNWDLILNHYEKDTTEELNNEVAKLMWDCARSVETRFEQSGSSALTDMFFYSAVHFFGYNSDSIRAISRTSYEREAWLDIIHNELSKKRPIYMSGSSYSHGGHAFMCDGYADGYLHINWGWNGSSNGYFDVDILDYNHGNHREQTTSDNGYTFFEKVIIGIEPGNGKTEVKLPDASSAITRLEDNNTSFSTRLRPTANGFMLYSFFESHKIGVDEKKNLTIGYVAKDGNVYFMDNGYSENYDHNILKINTAKEFDSSYIGKEIKLCVLESDHDDWDELVGDSIFDWWHVCEKFDTITVTIPDTIVNSDEIIRPISTVLWGEYSDSSVVLNAELVEESYESSMRYRTLALIANGDTLMSERNSDITESDVTTSIFKKTLGNPNFDDELVLIMMQTDHYSESTMLNPKEWSVCENYEPIKLKLSDITVFSKDVVVDTIIHTAKGTKQKFEITFSNPSQYEFYNDVYFLVDNEPTALMLSIPAGGKTTRIIERDLPLTTRYIDGIFKIYNNFGVAADMVFAKDTFGHVFYGFGDCDETTISLQLLNATDQEYTNTFSLCSGEDTISKQTATIKSLSGAEINYNLPVIKSDTNFIKLGLTIYSIYDKDNNLMCKAAPLDYQGKVSQSFENDEMVISIDLWPINDTILPTVIIGLTSSIEDTSSYEIFGYTPKPKTHVVSLKFKPSDYCTADKPRYFGLCKEDGTFYAYMELKWPETGSSSDIISDGIRIIAVDGGIWISSDVEIPSLPIYNIEGKLIKRVNISPESSLFVPLNKGIYIVGNKKVECRKL